MPTESNDEKWMRVALAEARKGVGLTSPNPPVGAVVVRGGKMLGKDHHRKAGEPHAEVLAIGRASKKVRTLKNATIYVTLEPCSTTGRTPPCCDAIVEAGIARVVYGMKDPNPAHAGRANRRLKEAGIEVTSGVLGNDCKGFLRPWTKWITTGLPWVIAKAGMSLDGRLTRPLGEGQWLTSPASRDDAQKLRAEVDAIIIGAETLRRDDPRLTLRGKSIPRGKEQPWRVVLTRSGRLPEKAKLFTDRHADRTLVFEKKSLRSVLRALGRRGVVSVLIEGGGRLLGDAVAKHLADEACFYIAPIVCGAATVPVLDGRIGVSRKLAEQQVRKIGDDLCVRGILTT